MERKERRNKMRVKREFWAATQTVFAVAITLLPAVAWAQFVDANGGPVEFNAVFGRVDRCHHNCWV
jgi:hypothetical protein